MKKLLKKIVDPIFKYSYILTAIIVAVGISFPDLVKGSNLVFVFFINSLLAITLLNIVSSVILTFFEIKHIKKVLLSLPILFICVFCILTMDVYKRTSLSPEECCRLNLRGTQSSLELYYTHYKYYPDKLETLIQEGYLNKEGKMDSWNNNFIYKPIYSQDSKDKANNYLLGSNGPDCKPNTDDDLEPPKDTAKHSFKTQPETTPEVKVKK